MILKVGAKEVILQSHNKNITFNQFLNRVNWAFGESSGNREAAQYYAHTINNLSNSMKKDEDEMFKFANTGVSHGIEENRRILFQGNGYGYKTFRENFRSDMDDLDGIAGINAQTENAIKARNLVKETINALAGMTSDPTNGATNWVGDQKENYAVNHSQKPNDQVTTVTTADKAPTYKTVNKKKEIIGTHNVTHSFHKLGNEKSNNHVKVDKSHH